MRRCCLLLMLMTVAVCVNAVCPFALFAQEDKCDCKVTVTCSIAACTYKFDPAKLKNMTDRQIHDRANEALSECDKRLGACYGFYKGDMRNDIIRNFKAIIAGPEQAITLDLKTHLDDDDVKCVNPEGNGGEVEISFCGISLTLLPTDAPQRLIDHEAGHRAINEHYWCAMLKAYVKKELERKICAKKYKSIDELNAEVRSSTSELYRDFHKQMIESYKKGQQEFDDKTKHGTEGDQQDEARKIMDGLDKAAHEKLPKDF